jgi:hypothetical protein
MGLKDAGLKADGVATPALVKKLPVERLILNLSSERVTLHE